MKLRQDFVTNSSSVSYIVTMYKPIVDFVLENNLEEFSNSKKRIIKLLYEDILINGTSTILDNVEVFTRKYQFNTDGDAMWENSYETSIENIDFESMLDDDVWALVYGEYIYSKKINEIIGFGITQTKTF